MIAVAATEFENDTNNVLPTGYNRLISARFDQQCRTASTENEFDQQSKERLIQGQAQ
jgi:hypothetical protein